VTRAAARAAPPELLAAVDLGSNSFHLVVARYTHGQLVVVDRLREMVRLGSGMDEEGRLLEQVRERVRGLHYSLRTEVRIPLIADTQSRLIADSVPGDRGHPGWGA
jgi:exopolyphosphatase/guanosine-5'-triphosphate,3'-diphosphate pyrophosphatase